MAGTLALEALVMILAVPAVAGVGEGMTWWSGGYVGLQVVLMLAGTRLQRRRWALRYNLALQPVMIAGWVVHPAIGVLGIVFALVWCFFLCIRREIAHRGGAASVDGDGATSVDDGRGVGFHT